MSRFTDPNYLKTDQYRDSSKLEAWVELHRRFSVNPQGWFAWVFDQLSVLPANANVLELGTGSGMLWKECSDRIPAGWTLTLSDLSDGMLDAAWRNLVVTGRNFKFERIDAQEIPYLDKTFDAVIANHMLYHVPDRKKAFSEIWRVLKDDGSLFAATNGEQHIKEINTWLTRAMIKGDLTKPSQPFLLENGLSQLQEFFSNVELSHYDNNLCVTEVEPIMAYIRSGIRALEFSESELAKIEKELCHQLASDGEIFITTDAGLFLAIK